MTTVTSLTADRMLAIEAASVVDGDVINGNLILTKHDGSQINAGPVTGPTGPPGPVGSLLPVLAARTIQDVGLVNQIRAGRQLTAADFTNMGLSAPLGLWNLSDLTDVSGNGRNFLNKGAVPFGTGINGGANTAAQFSGSTAQALYIPDTGANDPFRIKTGSIGCWFKSAKSSGTPQIFIAKGSPSPGQYAWFLFTNSTNFALLQVSLTGSEATPLGVVGVTNICDDRWHFIVGTHDASVTRIYVDGILEGSAAVSGIAFPGSGPLNIGAQGADGGTNGGAPNFGRIDEAFVTADILSDDQVRNLYCAKIPHTLGVAPTRVSLNVRRRRRGATLAVADFPTQPLRLYNFSGGSAGDEGSNGVTLTSARLGINIVAGVDGSQNNSYFFNGNSGTDFAGTDAGLPTSGPRSYGAWFKTSNGNAAIVMCWGGSSYNYLGVGAGATGCVSLTSPGDQMVGPYVADGQWHHAVGVEDNGAIDSFKRKLYIDGRLVATSLVFTPLNLAGAAHFRIGSYTDGASSFTGLIDGVFVCGYALTAEQISTLYAKSLLALAPSPKNVGDHIEAMDAASLFAIFDTLETNSQVDVGVAA